VERKPVANPVQPGSNSGGLSVVTSDYKSSDFTVATQDCTPEYYTGDLQVEYVPRLVEYICRTNFPVRILGATVTGNFTWYVAPGIYTSFGPVGMHQCPSANSPTDSPANSPINAPHQFSPPVLPSNSPILCHQISNLQPANLQPPTCQPATRRPPTCQLPTRPPTHHPTPSNAPPSNVPPYNPPANSCRLPPTSADLTDLR